MICKSCVIYSVCLLSIQKAVSQSTVSQQLVMLVNIAGLVMMVLFYLMVLGTGVWASLKSRRKQRKCGSTGMEMVLVGNRSIIVMVGALTRTGEK